MYNLRRRKIAERVKGEYLAYLFKKIFVQPSERIRRINFFGFSGLSSANFEYKECLVSYMAGFIDN